MFALMAVSHNQDHHPSTMAMAADLRPMVQVEAPCNMEAGFTFMATHDGTIFPVKVPLGGVRKGQTFVAPFSSGDLNFGGVNGTMSEGSLLLWPFKGGRGSTLTTTAYYQEELEPNGEWQSTLWDCTKYGYCHPSLWNAICCPQLLMAQVLTRLKLDWLGEPSSRPKQTFTMIFAIVMVYWTLSLWLAPDHGGRWSENANNHRLSWLRVTTYNVVYVLFAMYTCIVLTKLRRAVRRRRSIASGGPWEDLCVSFWCGCCSVAQLARETAEYETQPAVCCSRTGLRNSSSSTTTSTNTTAGSAMTV